MKSHRLVLLLSLVLLVVGVILVSCCSTPYSVCKMWISEWVGKIYTNERAYESYLYALQHIKANAVGYFGGIALMVVGGVSTILTIIKSKIEKSETKVSKTTHNIID